jgi:hypothetical protein
MVGAERLYVVIKFLGQRCFIGYKLVQLAKVKERANVSYD